jgi:pimeloyl-ACP methyl ester carboxylesterase
MSVTEAVITTPRGGFGIRTATPPDRRAGTAPGTVLCVHGFPDDASTFDGLASGLAAHGHTVASMYLRGYAPSDTDGPFTLDGMADDLAAVADAVSLGEPIHLIGHDYGAQLACSALARHPDAFRSAVLLSGAHPDAIRVNGRRAVRQLWYSRYIVWFQLAALADRAVARNDFAYLDRLWDRWSPGGVPVPDAVHRARVKRTIARSMPAPIAMYRGDGFSIGDVGVDVPTLFVAGGADRCISPRMSEGQDRWFTGRYAREVWDGVGHFPHLERPDRTLEAALSWFATAERDHQRQR